jgi:hypothetical protein
MPSIPEEKLSMTRKLAMLATAAAIVAVPERGTAPQEIQRNVRGGARVDAIIADQ